MERTIFHIDVNNAFLSWTAVKLLKEGYPIDIRKIPSIIGGDESTRHGIVLAKSPVAKRFGVVTAETIYSARKKCPNLQVFKSEMKYYEESSNKLFSYLSKYSPNIERFSIDECFIDITGTSFLYDNSLNLAYKIKDEILSLFGFTVNIGIANNKLCAKMASDFEKPNKVHTLFDNEIESKLWPLPIGELFMVGKKTATKLNSMGFYTIGDVAKGNVSLLKKEFKSFGEEIYRRANGIDLSIVESVSGPSKSISVSFTLEKDVDDISLLKKVLLRQSDDVGRSLRKQKKYASVITVTFKTYNFISYSKQVSAEVPIDSTEDIYQYAVKILLQAWNYEKIRNIGIRLSKLVDNIVEQTTLFDNDVVVKAKKDRIQPVIDKIKDKYGDDIIMPAILFEKDK